MKIVFLSSIRSSLLINNYDNENKNTISINDHSLSDIHFSTIYCSKKRIG